MPTCDCADDDEDKRIELSATLRKDLKDAKRSGYDVFAVTHLDNDHTCKADEFFYLDHASKYQEGDRAKISTLWVPAGVITESRNDLEPGARALQAEARHRLVKNYGIRVFSRPESLRDWLKDRGIELEDRQHLITDAGNVAPGLSLANDGVEFFIHSPFGWRQDEDTVIDRNGNSLVVQADVSGRWRHDQRHSRVRCRSRGPLADRADHAPPRTGSSLDLGHLQASAPL